MHKKILLFSSISGAFVVGLGAMGAHALKAHLDEVHMQIYDTAVKYQAYHTLALVGLSLWAMLVPSRLAGRAGILFMTGIILFSGSLYFLACRPLLGIPDDQMRQAGWFTPLGGIAFIAGWVLLFIYALKLKK